MYKYPENTAILVFTRTAVNEARTKRFKKRLGFRQNLAIAKAFIQKTIQIVEATPLPYFIVNDIQQKGDSFQERLSNTVQSIFDKGFENVIILGNDCPSLCSKCILKAHDELSRHGLIIAPSTDGGVNLIAINKAVFDLERFKNLPWLSKKLTAAFENYTSEKVFKLPLLADIDTEEDFSLFITSLTLFNYFVSELKQILGQLKVDINYKFLRLESRFFFSFQLLRGPPKMISFLNS